MTAIKIGDLVRPRREWIKDPNQIPSGRVVHIEKWGRDGAIFVEGSERAFAAYVFETASPMRGRTHE